MGTKLISDASYACIGTLPIALPETELRRGDILQIASFTLTQGQKAVLKMLNLSIIRYLNDGVVFDYINSSYGIATVGLFSTSMVGAPLVRASGNGVGIFTTNPYEDVVISLPGTYTVKVLNNTGRTYLTALDVAVSVTGAIKFYA